MIDCLPPYEYWYSYDTVDPAPSYSPAQFYLDVCRLVAKHWAEDSYMLQIFPPQELYATETSTPGET